MSAEYIDFFIDPETGEMEIKIEGLPDAVCDKVAAEVLKNLGMTIAIYPTKRLITITRQLYGQGKIQEITIGYTIIC